MSGKQKSHPAYHARTIKDVLRILKTTSEKGLSERQAEKRLEKYGANKLQEARQRNAALILADQFKSMVILVLLIAAIVAFGFQQWAEGIAIAAVLIVNAVIGFATEFKALRSMASLKALGGDTIRVRRNQEELGIDTELLVPGDIIVLESGDLVPADTRLTESNNLGINEAALTGESEIVKKHTHPVSEHAPLAEQSCMLFKGTTVTDGSGEGVVVGTGMATELGRISDLVAHAKTGDTPLQQRLDRLGRRLAWITLATAALIAMVGLLAGQDPQKMLETALALGVAAIPEGLPIVATIALARGMHLMARRNALIKKLPAVETLGATQVIFTDKTGTLTKNSMTLTQVITPAGEVALDTGGEEDKRDRATGQFALRDHLLEICVLCNNAFLGARENEGNNANAAQGDPTEIALLRGAAAVGLHRPALLEQKPELREEPFDSERMMMATFHRDGERHRCIVAVKGAPSRVLAACDRILDADMRTTSSFPDKDRKQWLQKAEEMAGEGLRLLAVADKYAENENAAPYENLRFLGFVGLMDPPRENIREAISACKSAGVRVVMVTGDQASTAAAIAEQTGLAEKGDTPLRAVHGNTLDTDPETDNAAYRRILESNIFARVSPEQKLQLIHMYQQNGMTVAMTGDGVNDTPALKKADIGVAMGMRGTDAARETADMVLQDDAFATIVAAIRHGRIIFDNIRKSVMFMLCTNVAEVTAVALAAAAGGFSRLPIPLLPLQILFLNVVTDVFPALALGVGAGDPGVMNRKPRPRDEAILTRQQWLSIAGWSAMLSLCVLCAMAIAFYTLEFDRLRAVTVSFLTLAFAKLWFVFNLRNPGSPILRNDIARNPFIWAALALCAGLLLAAVYLPGLSDVLKTVPPGPDGWLLILGMSLLPFLYGQTLGIIRSMGKG